MAHPAHAERVQSTDRKLTRILSEIFYIVNRQFSYLSIVLSDCLKKSELCVIGFTHTVFTVLLLLLRTPTVALNVCNGVVE